MPTPPPRQSQLRAVTGVWMLMLRRQWRHESSMALSALAFGGFLVALWRGGDVTGTAGFSVLFLVALSNAVAMSLATHGASLAAAPRLTFLPFAPRVRFAARVLFGSPLRIALLAIAVGGGVFHLVALDLPPARTSVALVQVLLVSAAAFMLAVVLSEPVAFAWLRAARTTFLALSAALTIVVLYAPRTMFSIAEAGGGWEFAVTAACATIALALFRAAFLWSNVPRAMPSGSSGRASFLARASGVLPPPLRKETLLLLRMIGLRPLIVLSIGVALLSFGAGKPWFLVALPVLWFGFFLNGLGADLPSGGVIRYHLAGIELARVLAWRHAAVLLVIAACVSLAALGIAATIGIAAPDDTSRWSYLALLIYAAATLLASAVPASRIAIRYPLLRTRAAWASGAQHAGPAALMVWAIMAGGLAVAFAAGAFILGGMAMRAVAPSSAGLVCNSLVAAAIAAAGYVLAIRRGWHAPE